MTNEPRFTLDYFTFPDLTQPKGPLSRDLRAQACWYFYTLAQKLKEMVGDSTEDQAFRLTDDEPWMDKRYEQIALSVTTMYGLDSPSEFAKAWDQVTECARRLKLPKPAPEYTKLMRGKLIH